MTLFVIACTEKKAPGVHAAALKYSGRQHNTLTSAFMGELFAAGHDLVVLSAEHGILSATQPVADYDRKMDARRCVEMVGSEEQRNRFRAALEGHDDVVVYGARRYRQVVLAWAGAEVDVTELTGADRGCGDHFSALQEYLATLDADA